MASAAAISPRFDAAIRAATAQQPFRLGLLGGTFDPVHIAHLHIAEQAYEQYSLGGVLLIPTGEPVWKLDGERSEAERRYAMAAAAVAGNQRFDISHIELERKGPTYTIDTLRAIKQRYADSLQLFFIVGADCAADIGNWKGAAEIAGLATILAAQRSAPQQSGDLRAGMPNLPDNGRIFDVRQIDSTPMGLSSRMLRQWVAQGRSIRYLVPEAVLNYIEDTGLYRD